MQNSKKTISLALLAAGEGKRLILNESKPMATLCGLRLMDYPLEAFSQFMNAHNEKYQGQAGIIVGHQKEAIYQHLEKNYPENSSLPLFTVLQKEQRGTADALKSFFENTTSEQQGDYLFVLCADTPLIRDHDLQTLFEFLETNTTLEAVVATFQTQTPKGYGRIVSKKGEKGLVIVEEKEATEEEKAICEVNSGCYLFKTAFIREGLKSIHNANKTGEFYLTDLFQKDKNVAAYCFEDGQRFTGVNTLAQLEQVESKIRQEKISILRQNGVRFLQGETTFIDWRVEVAPKTTIYPHTFLEGSTKIGPSSIIESGCIIKDSILEKESVILAHSYIEKSVIGEKASIGPFAHLRPESHIGPHAKIGNFVETKKATLAKGCKVSHLSYVGDASIGENTNIGCGFITCNYDGASKHKTTIGKECFIGSDCQAVAPVTIGDNCFVAAGTTITQDIPSEGFAIARCKQVTKEQMASRFIKKKRSS